MDNTLGFYFHKNYYLLRFLVVREEMKSQLKSLLTISGRCYDMFAKIAHHGGTITSIHLSWFPTLYQYPLGRYTLFNPKYTGVMCFPPPPVTFLLITSEVESFLTGNFFLFLILNEKLGQNKNFSKFASWVT